MSDSDRPNEQRPSDADRLPRADSGQPKAGRSATVAEIGRELGDLDFEPDDILASLRPFEPPNLDAGSRERAPTRDGFAAPKVPDLTGDAGEGIPPSAAASNHPGSGAEATRDALDQFSAEEVSTRAIGPSESAGVAPADSESDWSSPPQAEPTMDPATTGLQSPKASLPPVELVVPTQRRAPDGVANPLGAAVKAAAPPGTPPWKRASPPRPAPRPTPAAAVPAEVLDPSRSAPRNELSSPPHRSDASEPAASVRTEMLAPAPPAPTDAELVAPSTLIPAHAAEPEFSPPARVDDELLAPTAAPAHAAEPEFSPPARVDDELLAPSTAAPAHAEPSAPSRPMASRTHESQSGDGKPSLAQPNLAERSHVPRAVAAGAKLPSPRAPVGLKGRPRADHLPGHVAPGVAAEPPAGGAESDLLSRDPTAPDVTASEDAVDLEELVALPPERAEPLGFELERSAFDHVRERDLIDAFHAVAVVLTREAQAPRHPHEQADLALVNSELLSMLGELDTAREYLHALTPISTPATALQARQLAFCLQDHASYLQLLKGELRSQISHESRRHLMALYADAVRVLSSDEAEGRRHLELSLRAFPSDPRFLLQRLAGQSSDASGASKRRTQSLPDSPKLSDALRDLATLRSGTPKSGECAHPAGAMMIARQAWQTQDFASLLEALDELRKVDELSSGAAWLHACLTTFHPTHRRSSTAALETLIEQGDREAELALLERRLHESSDVPTSVEAFSLPTIAKLSTSDRLALGLAVGAHPDTLRVLTEDALKDDDAKVFARAVLAAHFGAEASSETSDPLRLRLALGQRLGNLTGPANAPSADVSAAENTVRGGAAASKSLPQEMAHTIEQLGVADPTDDVPRTMKLLCALWRCDPGELAGILVDLAPLLDEGEGANVYVAAALLAHLADAKEIERRALAQANTANPRLESARRAFGHLNEEDARLGLLELAFHLEPAERRTLLELEARIPPNAAPREEARTTEDTWSAPSTIAPLVRMLQASTSAKGSSTSAVVECESDAARSFSALLELFAHRDASQQKDAGSRVIHHDLRLDDPQTHAALTALGFEVPPYDLESTQLPEQLRDWLTARGTVDAFPVHLEHSDPIGLQALAKHRPSPITEQWLRLYQETHDGDAAAFDQRVASLSNASSDAEFIDSILECAQLDPEAEAGLGSIACARRVLERDPNHLASLRVSLRHAATHQRLHDTGRIAARLAQQLDTLERQAHTWLAIVSTTYTDDADADLEQAIHLDTFVSQNDVLPIWACRKLLGLAQAKKDDQLVFDCVNRLRESSTRALDSATLTLRAAEAASRLERWDDVGRLLERAVELYPEHLVALSMRAEYLEARGETARAALAYDALAEAACMPAHKVAAWVQAASLYRGESTTDTDPQERAILALERALELDPSHADATSRLRDLYLSRGDLHKLEGLLTRQLVRAEGANERAHIEFERAKALLDLQRRDEAESGLERALSLIPSHEPALVLAAQLKEERGDYEGAEQHLLRLAGLSDDPSTQLRAYRRLAELYETHLEQPARAEVAYREVLQREPSDPCAEKLVRLLLRVDNPSAAVELLQQLIERAPDPVTVRSHSLELARIFDAVLGDRRRAEEILDGTRRRWPNDAPTIAALAEFYRRGKDTAALSALLDRAVVDARRALTQGRFEPAFFEVIACVAELRDETDLGRVARATVAALNGDASDSEAPEPTGLGTRASEEVFSDLLAPDVLSLPLRAMLRKTGWALCSAHPIDVRAMRATPLAQTEPSLSEHLRELARGFGLFEIDLHLSPALGAVCQPTSSVPATLVVGPDFVALKDARLRDALAIRAFRILSANAAALANTPPVDLWPLLVAYLSAYLPDWLPPAMDANKISSIRQKIQTVLPRTIDADLPMLAADVAASIGNRASQLGIAVQQWGSRTALLALGDPGIVLSAIAAASGQLDRLASSAAERQKWIVRNPEARDLTIFSVSSAYVEARSKALRSE